MLLEIVVQDQIAIAIVFVFFIAIAWLLAEFKGMKDELKERLGINNDTLKFRIQAYERLKKPCYQNKLYQPFCDRSTAFVVANHPGRIWS